MKKPVEISLASTLLFIVFCGVALLLPMAASAHVSEQAFVLLLPTRAYILSGCISVLVSIIIVAVIPASLLDRLFATTAIRIPIAPKSVLISLSVLSTLSLFAICAVGFLGPRDPLINLLPLFFWTGFWVILFVAAGVIGNFWIWLNPWSGVCYLILGRAARRPPFKLSERLGIAPAICLFLLFFAFSIADPAPDDPDRLAYIVLTYWLVNFAAMTAFGCEEWMRRGEAFTVFFDQISRVAVVKWAQGLSLGFPGWQLVKGRSNSIGFGVLALVVLGAGSFDGLKETFWWLALLGINPLEFPGRTAVMTSSLVGMILCVVALIGAFAAVAWIGKALGNRGKSEGDQISLRAMFCAFAPTVLPIALAFHASHFTVTFLINGQYLLAAMGDPLANGSNLFGLGQVRVTTGFLNAPNSVKTIWLSQAGMVVFGHILAVVLSHRKALLLFERGKHAVLSQIPLGAFMVLYTLFGLWLLATPRGI